MPEASCVIFLIKLFLKWHIQRRFEAGEVALAKFLEEWVVVFRRKKVELIANG
jgi:hypothetical protein